MKPLRAVFAIWLISISVAVSQPFPPLLRNAMTTNIAGTPVRSVNNLSVTNLSGGITYTQWNFYGRSPETVARLTDISNIVNSVSGSATNAVSTIESNGVVVTAMATNLNFVDSPTVTVLMTNNPSGRISVAFTATGSGGGGETNWNGNAGTTNATRIGLADGKSNNTNLIKTLQGGNGIVLTNEAGGTNVVFSIDPAVVASQSNLGAASNFLYSIAGETNWVADAFGTNANRFGWYYVKEGITNYLKTFSAGFGMAFTNQTTNVVFAVDNAVIASQVNLNASSNALRSDISTKQTGRQELSNLVDTVAFNVTNVVSLSTSNALSKPITNLYSAGTLTLRGIEAGANVTITANPSNYVIAAAGGGSGALAIQTNRVNLGTETNLNFITGNGIIILSTNLSGTNDIQFVIDPAVVASQVNLNAASNVLRTDISNLQGSTNFFMTNVVSLSTTNSLSKPLTNSYVNGVLVLRGIEAGANVTITANPSNYVIAATGGGSGMTALDVMTNATGVAGGVRAGLVTNIVFKFPPFVGFATNFSGSNTVELTVNPYPPLVVIDMTNIIYQTPDWDLILFEEFTGNINIDSSGGNMGWHYWTFTALGGTASPVIPPFEPGVSGIVGLAATNANSGYCINNSASPTISSTNNEMLLMVRFKLNKTNDSSDHATFRCGFTGSGVTRTEPANSIHIRTSTNANNGMDLVTTSASTTTVNSFPVGLVQNAWTNAGFYLNATGTNVIAFIGNSRTNMTSFATNTANIPNSSFLSCWLNTYKQMGSIGNTNFVERIELWTRRVIR